MALAIVPLSTDTLPALRRFAEKVWQRPRSEDYYRWRYVQPPFHRAWLAMKDGEVLAMEAAIQRPWRLGEQTVDVLEVFDWFALPELRNVGTGVRVMQALMKEPHPLMLVGGSADTQGLLPRLSWQRVATSSRWILALGTERTGAALERRLRLPPALARAAASAALRRPGQRPRPRAVPRGGRVLATASIGPELLALYRGALGYGTLPMWTEPMLRWLLAGFPGAGHFVPLCFAIDERPVGWSLLRVYPTATGCDAEILELFAPEADADLYTWMVSETTLRAAGFRPGLVGARTTCPAVETAFRRNRFWQTSSDPVNFWLDGQPAPPGPYLVGSNTNDAAIVPMVERWWDAPS